MTQAGLGGIDFWDRIDAANDETFENRVKGTRVTALDAAISDPPLGQLPAVSQVLADITAYCLQDLGEASFDAYLTARRWRIDQRAAACWREVMGVHSLSPANVHAAGDSGVACPGLVLGSLVRGGSLVAGALIDETLVAPSPLLARVTALGNTADWSLSVTAMLAGEDTKTLSETVLKTGNGGQVGDVYILGKQAVGATAAAGQKDVVVTATGQFAAGQTVLITEWTGSAPEEVWAQQEWGVIDSVTTDAKITLVDDLLHTYTTAAFVYPCFRGVSAASGTNGSSGDAVTFYPAADRRLRL